MASEINVTRLRELLEYNPRTGELIWKQSRRGRAKRGLRAGSDGINGYRQIVIDGRNYIEHRVVWLHVHGVWHRGDIDHINGVRNDNRIENLRAVDRSANMRNARMPKRNTSGHIGVTWDGFSGKWKAQMSLHGKNVSLGRFTNIEDAIAARDAASAANGFTERHGC